MSHLVDAVGREAKQRFIKLTFANHDLDFNFAFQQRCKMEQLIENYQRLIDNWEILLIVAGLVVVSLIMNWFEFGKFRLNSEEMAEYRRQRGR